MLRSFNEPLDRFKLINAPLSLARTAFGSKKPLGELGKRVGQHTQQARSRGGGETNKLRELKTGQEGSGTTRRVGRRRRQVLRATSLRAERLGSQKREGRRGRSWGASRLYIESACRRDARQGHHG